MEIWALPALMALLILCCLASGIWLVLHLTAVTTLFRGKADIVPAPRRPRASAPAVIIALSVFGSSLFGIFASQLAVFNS
ncbi:MAG: hypothetical protein U0S50_04855 [Sphingopyxis sp.]|uniref:hypothetical protein n=1 Tax=Sphingopyxis sp. TaxID=1908224 RepID=UPI002ABB2812|nr:hypothetical protein [Sphingopyxis sp.]MDZ3831131.1 hypothetical protein [Sphingopyxis sp.]